MRIRRVVVATAACAVMAVPSAASAAKVGFSTPTIVDPISTFGEPSIGIDPVGGDVFASGPTGTGVQRSQWEASSDGGQTFRIMTPAVPPTAIQSTEDPPGGGDTDLNFDRSGKQYFADLYALACLRTATSTNTGDDIQTSPDGCSSYAGADRQCCRCTTRRRGRRTSPRTPDRRRSCTSNTTT